MVEMNSSVPVAQEKILELTKQYGVEHSSASETQKKAQSHQKAVEEEKLKEELQELTQKYNQEMKKLNTNISFDYNDTIKGLLVTVKEANTEKVIREIPSKEAIELMKKMHDLVGAIFDKRG